MSACGVRVLSVPALLAVCLCSFPVLLLAGCAQSARSDRIPFVCPALLFSVCSDSPESCASLSLPPTGCPIPSSPAAALFSACSGTDPLRCHGFLQFSPCRLEIDRTAAPPSDQPSQCPGMRSLCCRCSSMSLAISWQYKSR